MTRAQVSCDTNLLWKEADYINMSRTAELASFVNCHRNSDCFNANSIK